MVIFNDCNTQCQLGIPFVLDTELANRYRESVFVLDTPLTNGYHKKRIGIPHSQMRISYKMRYPIAKLVSQSL